MTDDAVEEAWIVLGDVVDSREINDRTEFRHELTETLRTVNERHESEILSNFVTTKGIDEIGGVLGSIDPLVELQRTIYLGVHPREIRLAVVSGAVEGVGADVRGMDGTGFVEADDELRAVEARETTFSLSGLAPGIDELATAGVNMLDLVRNDWTTRRVEVLETFREVETQRDVAEQLGITPQAVSAHLTAKSVQRVHHVEATLDSVIVDSPFDDGREF